MHLRGHRPARVLAAALLLCAGLLAGPMSAPSPVAGVGPLPGCTIGDILTIPRGYDDWQTTLVDWTLSVGPSYKPPDLVSVRKGGVGGGGLIRKVVIEDLKALAAAAKDNGTPIVAWSPYRSAKQQATLFNGGVKSYGYASAITYWGRPGHSEHQLGVTIDFVAVGDGGLTSNWEVTRTGGWMAKNAWKYGWLMSYPKGKQNVVCYHYEPWHYRYFGRELAKKIHDSGLTTREYLWANFTQIDPSGQPVAAATGAPTSEPTSAPAAGPTVGPSGSAGGNAASGDPRSTPAATLAPASAGVEPTFVFAIILIALAAIGAVASVQFLRHRQRSLRRR